jgi:UDP-N-acetyl-D-galactosamine dehydrogenase
LNLTQTDGRNYDLVIGAVAHREYKELDQGKLEALVAPGGTLADLKGMWRRRAFSEGLDVWAL